MRLRRIQNWNFCHASIQLKERIANLSDYNLKYFGVCYKEKEIFFFYAECRRQNAVSDLSCLAIFSYPKVTLSVLENPCHSAWQALII